MQGKERCSFSLPIWVTTHYEPQSALPRWIKYVVSSSSMSLPVKSLLMMSVDDNDNERSVTWTRWFPAWFSQLRDFVDQAPEFLRKSDTAFHVLLGSLWYHQQLGAEHYQLPLWVHGNLFWQLAGDGSLHGLGMSHATTASPTPRSAEEMLDGQYQRVDIPAHARSTQKGLPQKRLEEISAESSLFTPRRPNRSRDRTELHWTELWYPKTVWLVSDNPFDSWSAVGW